MITLTSQFHHVTPSSLFHCASTAPQTKKRRAFSVILTHRNKTEIAYQVVIDDSGNRNDGTIIDAKQCDGKVGKGLELEKGNRVEIAASDSLHPNLFQEDFTLAMWINPTREGDTWQQLWRSRKDDNHSTLFLNNDGTLSWRGDVGEGWTIIAEVLADPPAEEWSHILFYEPLD
jgi:hypothetical protein